MRVFFLSSMIRVVFQYYEMLVQVHLFPHCYLSSALFPESSPPTVTKGCSHQSLRVHSHLGLCLGAKSWAISQSIFLYANAFLLSIQYLVSWFSGANLVGSGGHVVTQGQRQVVCFHLFLR